MSILSIGQELNYTGLTITSIRLNELQYLDLGAYDYIIIHGGDGSVRRTVDVLDSKEHHAVLILNPIGSFNVIAKMHRVPQFENILEKLVQKIPITLKKQVYYKLNEEVFLFSAGNMGDVQHIFLAETLRFGVLTHGMSKYIVSFLALLPLHLIITPFMLLSSQRFFIFTPASFIKKFGSFYGEVQTMSIDLGSDFNTLELDGDLVSINEQILNIRPAGHIEIAT